MASGCVARLLKGCPPMQSPADFTARLASVLSAITLPREAARREAQAHWDALAKPLGSLGLLEDAVASIAALTGSADVRLDRRLLVVACADNGVVAQGVTQCGSDVTALVATALAEGRSTVCSMARVARCEVLPVDVGIRDYAGAAGVLDRRVANGTADISQGPALSRSACERAVCAGIDLVGDLAAQGVSIVATGEMGIGNTTTSSAVACVLLGAEPAEMTGRGAGLSDEGLGRKKAVITQAIALNAPDPQDPIDVLAKVGGLDIAFLCGVFVGCAYYRVPALVDGCISAVAALAAVRLCPQVHKALLASHVSAEPAGARVLDALGLRPLITAEMRLGEGSGAVAALPLLDMALAVYSGGTTFDGLGMDAYVPLS